MMRLPIRGLTGLSVRGVDGVRRSCCLILMLDLIRANPKAFIGYSDHTSLHCWLQNEANLVTFYGPMVAADFARDEGVDLGSWSHGVAGSEGVDAGCEGWLESVADG